MLIINCGNFLKITLKGILMLAHPITWEKIQIFSDDKEGIKNALSQHMTNENIDSVLNLATNSF